MNKKNLRFYAPILIKEYPMDSIQPLFTKIIIDDSAEIEAKDIFLITN